ncbi:biotin-dependent carboxyltransferase family protein [Microlunatus panaciterrae]|uniref:Biotin-dependent carboxylase-like uncharacterized protein n=1 Tax=Microlunatus panaciterrae TaxID=400768 RepID=A0ABS2RMA0_9ACTN|nr:biotin-dependent carboxyltransferase family protein [Microlunatus panaciterrae]MBM7799722.1 biotin-dependent carboxylase-like uncharacterized protein [Microlunatus panaciterrae]
MIVVERAGPLTLVEDLGRPGLAHLGVSPSGAADRFGLRLANRLVGNSEDAAVLETTLGGLTIRATDLHWVAVTGARTEVVVNGTPTSSHTGIRLVSGDRLTVSPPAVGLRNYLAVRGGIEAPTTLGSRSADVLSGLGPPPMVDGQQLRILAPTGQLPPTDFAPSRAATDRLHWTPGPRMDWFEPSSVETWSAVAWTVTGDSNRVAVRLQGPPLKRVRRQELPSEGLLRGAVQVPPSGQPLIFMADHPVTGGYPVIAVLDERSCDRAAQLRPGDTVRLHPGRGARPSPAGPGWALPNRGRLPLDSETHTP